MKIDKKELLKESWYRCYERGLPKDIDKIQSYINEKELENKLEENWQLIRVFKEEVKKLERKYSLKDNIFLLTDSKGGLIAGYDSTNKERIIRLKGAVFIEESCGTNAISLAMKLQKEVFLAGEEHYCNFFKEWTCIAIPIEINKKVAAYLDMSLLGRNLSEKDKLLFNLVHKNILLGISKQSKIKEIEKIQKGKEYLTQAEKEVAVLSAKGYKIKEISNKLNFSEPAVKYYRKKLCKKLKAKNIIHAIAIGIKNGYIETDLD
ncbi:LuxR C-terminal-related transcriptional regulator [Halonatronum saccharophilum]|uniref:LuxR C-terminal-related transcriptional regulator n=1 Tax=Halonatronum saccharophilum TaxID=150060 RepID=UPI0004885ECA|nr:LuxR C-terminal-related transcriptional regulator [Halonatronum saccharophilum]